MKVLIDIPSEEINKIHTEVSNSGGKVLAVGKDMSLLFYTRDDAAGALKVAGLLDKVLEVYNREEIIDSFLRKVQDSFDADLPVNYEYLLVIAKLVASDYNGRVRLLAQLPVDTANYKEKQELIHDGIKPIDAHNEVEVNEIRVSLWDAVLSLAKDIGELMKNPVEDNLARLQAGIDFLREKEKEIDTRLFITFNVVDRNALKAILYPTVMPFDFDKEKDYLFASVTGLDSFKAFIDDLHKCSAHMDGDFLTVLRNNIIDYINRPYGGKCAYAMKAVLKACEK